MPAYVSPFIGLALGALFAWARVSGPEADPAESARQLGVVALFSLAVFMPVAGYFVVFEGDWAYGYFFDARRVPSAVDLSLCLLDAAAVPLGFWLTRSRLIARKMAWALAALAAPMTLALCVVVALGSRLGIAATFEQFEGSYGLAPLSGSALGLSLLWMNGVLIAGVFLTVHALRRAAPRATTIATERSSGPPPLSRLDTKPRPALLLAPARPTPPPALPRLPGEASAAERPPRLLGRPRPPR